MNDSLSWWYVEDIFTWLQRSIVEGRQRCIACRTHRLSRNYLILPFPHIFLRSDVRHLSSDISVETYDLTKFTKKKGLKGFVG